MLERHATHVAGLAAALSSIAGAAVANRAFTHGILDRAVVAWSCIALCGAAAAAWLPRLQAWAPGWRPRASEEEAAVRRILASLALRSVSATRGPDLELKIEVESSSKNTPTRRTSSAALIAEVAEGKSRRIQLIGPAGAGKSAVATRLAVKLGETWLSGESQKVPLYIPLQMWDRPEPSPHDFEKWLEETCARLYSVRAPLVAFWIRTGGAVLVLDGLETVVDDCRDRLISALNSWASHYEASVLATCRKDVYLGLRVNMEADAVASILPLEAGQLESLVSRLAAIGMADAGRLIPALERVLDQNPAWTTALRTPLIASLIAEGTPMKEEDQLLLPGGTEADDVGLTELLRGDSLLKKGQLDSAARCYRHAHDSSSAGWRAQAAFRIGLVMEMQGLGESAHEAFVEALSLKVQKVFDREYPAAPLTAEEKKIVSIMEAGVGYDTATVACDANLSVSAAEGAISQLKQKGLVELLLYRPRARYALSSVEAVEGLV